MNPKPIFDNPNYKGTQKLLNKVALITEENETLIDYSSSKEAINSFTKSLALPLATRNIRVNSVSPEPIWTPLIPFSFDEKVSKFGNDTLLKRPVQPIEVAEAYLYLACNGATYASGQTIHINGGEIVNN